MRSTRRSWRWRHEAKGEGPHAWGSTSAMRPWPPTPAPPRHQKCTGGGSVKLGINTYGYIWSTPMTDCVRRLHGLGYDDFEIVVNPPHCPLDEGDSYSRRRLASSLQAEGIALRSLNLPSLDTNLASPMARMRAYSVGVFRSAIDLASDLGIARL